MQLTDVEFVSYFIEAIAFFTKYTAARLRSCICAMVHAEIRSFDPHKALNPFFSAPLVASALVAAFKEYKELPCLTW